jgi:uncharacterized protein YutE (UPF0331/DUF86 family)
MTNVDLLTRKLATLDEHLRRLRERRPDDLATFRADTLLQDAVALSVLVVVQEAIDIALHMASDEGGSMPPAIARHSLLWNATGSWTPR